MGTNHLWGALERPYLKLFLFAARILSERGWEESLVFRFLLHFLCFSRVPDPSLPLCLVCPSLDLVCFNFSSVNFLSSIRNTWLCEAWEETWVSNWSS